MKDKPSILYKYKSFNQNSLDMILTGKVFFSSPLDFNDPLDCVPLILNDEVNQDVGSTLGLLYKEKIKNQFKKALGNEFNFDQVSETIMNYFEARADELVRLDFEQSPTTSTEQSIGRELIQYFDPGVLSLSESDRNHLMWSHYADEHRGYCFEYELPDSEKDDLFKVRYYNDSQAIKISEVNQLLSGGDSRLRTSIWNRMMVRKLSNWKYEREWRVIKNGTGLLDTDIKLKGITFGLFFSKNIRDMIVESVGIDGVSYKQVVRSDKKNNLRVVGV